MKFTNQVYLLGLLLVSGRAMSYDVSTTNTSALITLTPQLKTMEVFLSEEEKAEQAEGRGKKSGGDDELAAENEREVESWESLMFRWLCVLFFI